MKQSFQQLLFQLNFIAGAQIDRDTCDDWMRLAAQPISSRTDVIALQRHLATAAITCAHLLGEVRERSATGEDLREANSLVTSLRDKCDSWQCKYEGENLKIPHTLIK